MNNVCVRCLTTKVFHEGPSLIKSLGIHNIKVDIFFPIFLDVNGILCIQTIGIENIVYFFHDISNMRWVKNWLTSYEFQKLVINVLTKNHEKWKTTLSRGHNV
jgi:hypothetical protein